eukprot:COSAG02_NODE_3545_length_6583_cov_2.896823_6_plen_147_part_00
MQLYGAARRLETCADWSAQWVRAGGGGMAVPRALLLLWAAMHGLLETADGIWNVHSHHHVWAAARQGHIGALPQLAHAWGARRAQWVGFLLVLPGGLDVCQCRCSCLPEDRPVGGWTQARWSGTWMRASGLGSATHTHHAIRATAS